MPRWQFVLDAVVAVAFALVLGGLIAAAGQWSSLSVVGLLALAMALRHRHVWSMIGLAVLAGLVQLFLTDVVLPADATYAVLFFTLGAHVQRPLRVTGLNCAVLATVVAGVYTGLQIRLWVVNSLSDRQESVGSGQGIMGMRERATVVGGTATSSRTNGRWVLEAYLPEPARSESDHREVGQ